VILRFTRNVSFILLTAGLVVRVWKGGAQPLDEQNQVAKL
jgi:hypothetical protein